MATVVEQRGSVDGIATRWLEAPAAPGATPVLYVHGVPTGGWEWEEFLARGGGYAPDLPGFGASDKLASFEYSIDGYARWLRAFADLRELDRFALVVHDWGAAGLALAQAIPERIERLTICSAVPLLPGYRWHRIARLWRTPVVGELAMGFTFKLTIGQALARSNREPIPASFLDRTWEHFDHGTQRAILKLYRSAPPERLAEAGTRLGDVDCPALVVHGGRDPYISAAFADRYGAALGGETTVRLLPEAGHWPWLDEPALIDEIVAFATGGRSSHAAL